MIRARHDLAAQEVEDLENRLYAFNVEQTGLADGEGLAFMEEDDRGLAGAVAGYSWGGMVELRQVWVRQDRRGGGLGRALMQAAIGEAQARRCTHVLLATYDFQAPGFYAGLGFREVARVADKPAGHWEIILRLDLGALAVTPP